MPSFAEPSPRARFSGCRRFGRLPTFWHVQQGLQVVIEDYVHGAGELALQVLVKFVCAVSVVASLLAIGRLVFAA